MFIFHVIDMNHANPNTKAIKILGLLLLTVAGLFSFENKFLVPSARGETISFYQKIPWYDKIILLVDDFEGLQGDSASMEKEKFFRYGSIQLSIDSSLPDQSMIASRTSVKVKWNGEKNYGGWGKGIGKNINLECATDHLNFRIYTPECARDKDIIRVLFQEDDNNDGFLQEDKDDIWSKTIVVPCRSEWQLISIPLKDFTDINSGGDGELNVTRKGGLHNIIFSFEQAGKYSSNDCWYFDFVCFTKGEPGTI